MKTSLLIHWLLLFVAIQDSATFAQMQMISDFHFQSGFIILSPSGSVEGNLQHTGANGPPQWIMAQWGSRQSIYGTPGQNQADGSVKWTNGYKKVIYSPNLPTEADLVLGVDSRNEYGGDYRSAGVPWTHLLVQQSISEPGGWRAATAPSILQMNHALLHLEVRLARADNVYTAGYSPSLHAAQFPIYFTIQNLNPSSSGYGK